MDNTILQIKDVHFRWTGHSSFTLNVPDFQLRAGEKLLLLGESGSGKSSLLSLICGTVLPDTGQIILAGKDIAKLSGGARDRYRAEQIGVIFQQFNLLPFGTVKDNILLPLQFAPMRRKRVADAAADAATLCQSLGLPAEVLSMRAGTLSVGQQQRVAVARALIGQPPLIIADEPTSSLDASNQSAFLKLLLDQADAHQTSVLMVSHDPRLAEHFDRVVDMRAIASVSRETA